MMMMDCRLSDRPIDQSINRLNMKMMGIAVTTNAATTNAVTTNATTTNAATTDAVTTATFSAFATVSLCMTGLSRLLETSLSDHPHTRPYFYSNRFPRFCFSVSQFILDSKHVQYFFEHEVKLRKANTH